MMNLKQQIKTILREETCSHTDTNKEIKRNGLLQENDLEKYLAFLQKQFIGVVISIPLETEGSLYFRATALHLSSLETLGPRRIEFTGYVTDKEGLAMDAKAIINDFRPVIRVYHSRPRVEEYVRFLKYYIEKRFDEYLSDYLGLQKKDCFVAIRLSNFR